MLAMSSKGIDTNRLLTQIDLEMDMITLANSSKFYLSDEIQPKYLHVVNFYRSI